MKISDQLEELGTKAQKVYVGLTKDKEGFSKEDLEEIATVCACGSLFNVLMELVDEAEDVLNEFIEKYSSKPSTQLELNLEI